MNGPSRIPPALPPKPLSLRVKRLIATAQAMLVWERFAPVLLVGTVALLIFLSGAFAGVWERIGDPWRGLALVAALALVGLSLWRARDIRFPTRSAAKRRVESDNAVAHRPLDTIEDSPRVTERGWNTHLARAEAVVNRLRGPRLKPALAEADQAFLRYFAPLLLVAAAVIGWGANGERLRMALAPTWLNGVNPSDAVFEAYIDPPDYTGRRPVTLQEGALADVPEGSEFVARITGIPEAPRLILSDGRRIMPRRLGPESFEARATLDESTSARLRVGARRQVWDLDIVMDQPPSVDFTDAPEADKRDRLALRYDLADDYGVETLTLSLQPLTDEGDPTPEPESVTVPLRGAPVESADGTLQPLDLSRHRWAGRKARGVLVATDGKGQIVESKPAFFTIPNKIFVEPLAKAVIEQRALVLAGMEEDGSAYAPRPDIRRTHYFDTFEPAQRLDRAPESFARAVDLIDAVTEYPEDGFDDPVVFMGLRHTAYALRYADSSEDVVGLDEELWNIAIRAEFGRIGSALENMQRAQEQLNAAIARRAPQREIDTLFDRYNEAVDAYLEVLREEATMSEEAMSGGQGGQNVDEIQELLDAIEEANRIGDTEGARLALARLAELLENMQIQLSPSAGGGGGDGPPPPEGQMSEELRDSLEELADTIGEQRDLRDDTRRAEREGDEDGQDAGDESQSDPGGDLTDRQETLADRLDGVRGAIPDEEVRELGEGGEDAADALDGAGEAMDRAAELLRRGNLDGAGEAQDEAIELLREAGRNIGQALRDRQEGEGEDGPDGEEAANPFGQEQGGENDPNARQNIDPQDPAARSRAILEELRRRAAEQERSQEERDYLERLMERF